MAFIGAEAGLKKAELISEAMANIAFTALTMLGLYFARVGAKNDAKSIEDDLFGGLPKSGTAPKLPAILLVLIIPFAILASGCVNAKIHYTATRLDRALAPLHGATIPSPRYSDPHDSAFDPTATAKIEALWTEAHGAVTDISEASK